MENRELLTIPSSAPFAPVMDPQKFSEIVGVSKSVVDGWMKRGYLPTIKIGKRRLVNMVSMNIHLESHPTSDIFDYSKQNHRKLREQKLHEESLKQSKKITNKSLNSESKNTDSSDDLINITELKTITKSEYQNLDRLNRRIIDKRIKKHQCKII